MKKMISLIFIFAMFGSLSFATTGGMERIDVLGSSPKDGSVYFTYSYIDESGRVPDLLIYTKKDNILTIEKLPEWKRPSVSSEFSNFKDYFDYIDRYKGYLSELKKNLEPLSNILDNDIKISSRDVVYGFFNPEPKYDLPGGIPYWKQEITILKGDKVLSSFELESYIRKGVETVAMLETPDKSVKFIILRYNGKWWEMGYTKDYLAVIPQEAKRIEGTFDISKLKR